MKLYSLLYLKAEPVSGYSGFVLYDKTRPHWEPVACNHSCWMIPGTFFDDWDNQ
jgi:hypothetical protein